MNRLMRAFALISCWILLSCGSSYSPSGGVSYVGGAVGSTCDVSYHNQGCSAGAQPPTIVRCVADPATGAATWQELAKCGANQYCLEQADPTDTAKVKKLAVCKDVSQGGSTPNQSSSGGASSGGTSGGGASPWQQELACIDQKCAPTIAQCEANSQCATIMKCVRACNDENCAQACSEPFELENNPELLAALAAIAQCAETQGCDSLSGGSSSGGSSGGASSGGNSSGGASSGGASSGGASSGGASSGGASSGGSSSGGGAVTCGNLVCEAGETAATCALDCDKDVTPGLVCAEQKCSAQWTACKVDPVCIAALNCITLCDDEACTSGCASTAGSAAAILQSLGSCLGANCADDIPGSSSGGSSGGGSSSGGSSSGGASSGGSSSGGGGACTETDSSPCKSGQKCEDGACVSNGFTGSCQGFCGNENETAGCWCDSECQQYGDCCPDKDSVCP